MQTSRLFAFKLLLEIIVCKEASKVKQHEVLSLLRKGKPKRLFRFTKFNR